MIPKRLVLFAALMLCLAAAACSGSQTGATGGVTPGASSNDLSSRTEPTAVQLAVSQAQGKPILVPGRYIVILKNATNAQRDALAATLATAPTHVYTSLFKGFAGDMTPAEVTRLQANPLVRLIEQDRWNSTGPTDDPQGTGTGSGRSVSSQGVDWGVQRIKANLNTGPRGAGVGVVILDTGCDLNHPDLAAGYVGVSYNGIFPTRNGDDDFGHGTHCAGIIGMRDNSIGYVGVAPACNLIAVKGLNERGFGETSWIVLGMDWIDANIANYNIKVVSMSFGGFGYDGAEDAAIQQGTTDGITFVAAAGNSDAKIPDNFFSPACLSNVIAVSALQSGDTLAGFSDWGPRCDVIAPGVGINSTFPSSSVNGGYANFSGTSMACPHVSGCCALWFSNHAAPGGAANFTAVKAALLANSEAAPVGGWPNGNGFVESEPLVNALNLDQP